MKIEELFVNNIIVNEIAEEYVVAGFVEIYETDFNSFNCGNIVSNNDSRKTPLTKELLESTTIKYRESIAYLVNDQMSKLPKLSQIYAHDLVGKHILLYSVENNTYEIRSQREIEKCERA